MNILKLFKKNRGKLKDFYLSVIAGLFSGLGVGIFFNLTTEITFNRWINIFSYEIIATIIYILFVFIVLGVFYILGVLIIIYIIKDVKRILPFHLNFIAGVYSSAITFLLVLYYNQPMIRNTIAIIGGVLFFILAYITVKKKWPKK